MPDEAYGKRSGRTSRERSQERALDQAQAEFAGSVAGREYAQMQAQMVAMGLAMAALKAEIAAMQAWRDNLRGDGSGIEVKGNVLMLRKRALDGGGLITVMDEGTTITESALSLNFVGSTVSAASVLGAVTITITGGDTTNPTNSGSGKAVLKTGTNVVARSLTAGSGITLTENTDDIVIAITGGTYSLTVKQDGTTKESAATTLDFQAGSCLTVTGAAGVATIEFEVLEWIGCSAGSPVYKDSISHITGSYP